LQVSKAIGIVIDAPKYSRRSSEDLILLDCKATKISPYKEANKEFRFFQTDALKEGRIHVAGFSERAEAEEPTWFRDRRDEAGLPNCSAPGLRKAFLRRMAEAGCSEDFIASISGQGHARDQGLRGSRQQKSHGNRRHGADARALP
jgi:hypothetical protein